MRRKHKTKSAIISHMNVVPYIDVMLVLLVIFMVTAPMFVPGVINLPSVGHASQISHMPIEINIDSNYAYSLTQNNKTQNISNLNELISTAKTLTNSETPVVISADKNIKYENVIQVVDQLYAANIKKVALVVKDHP